MADTSTQASPRTPGWPSGRRDPSDPVRAAADWFRHATAHLSDEERGAGVALIDAALAHTRDKALNEAADMLDIQARGGTALNHAATLVRAMTSTSH